ncbi:MAG: 16S rRNA (adenine(1518)-N(6)/adenine(1519)-N(6))-dimethyltransferase RsmA [Porticoccaceae bacterium]|nr:16S rRNA (adenine(1518)-N(6)/adenine(1519)-N(6))-dimethyltransferase RsmA [Porticoccaceae bacterium]
MSKSHEADHRARRRFGQNFLHDVGIISAIGNAIAPAASDHLVEIGPGLGALTAELIGRADKLTLIELDRDLIPRLEQRFADQPNWQIISSDALDIDFTDLAHGGKIRVVGNLPYNISTPLIFHLLEHVSVLKDMHFMLQKEVVQRLTAEPNSGAWGRLAIMVQYFCDAEYLLDVPPSAFDPAPKVDSAVVRLTPRAPSLTAKSLDNLELLVKTAFSQRRKTLRNTLKTLFNADQLLGFGIDPGARPENLTLEQYVHLANQLTT